MPDLSAPDGRRAVMLTAAVAAAAAAGAVATARGVASPGRDTPLLCRVAAVPDAIAGAADRRRIAVVTLRGVIGGTLRAPEVSRQLQRIGDDARTRGVLLDIDSPGGSAIESEALFLAVRRLAERKPVVAWVRGTGASGSYFLACGATRILAFPGAIVGSIGVISARPVLAELLRRVGASMEITKTGPFKDLGAPWREPTEADRAKEQSLVDAVFRRFTGAVATARHLSDEQLAAVTTGEVWLAGDAMALGLVDALAEEEEALAEVQRLAGLPRRRVQRVERRRSLGRRLGLPFAEATADGGRWIAEVEGWLAGPRLTL